MARKQAAKRAAKDATREERRRPAVSPLEAPAAAPTRGIRAASAAERRDAILAAALEEFAASGFAATRLDDVARRAGVAKGTIYLYFRDKESLFQELVRATLVPMVGDDRDRAGARPAGARHRRDHRRHVRARDLRHPPQGRASG